ncbi:MAG: ribosome recycling factor [Thermodesulfobacteriota bacterium]
MSKKILNDLEEKMNKTLKNLQGDFNKVRTGRASLALFDDIRVDYYGTPTPLKQMATLSVPESRLIIIQPWDTQMIGEIEKAILKSELGVTPTNDGKVIRLTIPRLTEERRRELVKIIKKMGEGGKVAIRNIRRDANEDLKDMEREKLISQDELHQNLDEIQKVTDGFIRKIDEVLSAKEREILEI